MKISTVQIFWLLNYQKKKKKKRKKQIPMNVNLSNNRLHIDPPLYIKKRTLHYNFLLQMQAKESSSWKWGHIKPGPEKKLSNLKALMTDSNSSISLSQYIGGILPLQIDNKINLKLNSEIPLTQKPSSFKFSISKWGKEFCCPNQPTKEKRKKRKRKSSLLIITGSS